MEYYLHTVAIVLGVLSQLLVLVEQLRRIATRPAVDPIALVRAALLAISAPAATVIAIVVQRKIFLIISATGDPICRFGPHKTPPRPPMRIAVPHLQPSMRHGAGMVSKCRSKASRVAKCLSRWP
jgi:hypothetical protein